MKYLTPGVASWLWRLSVGDKRSLWWLALTRNCSPMAMMRSR